jgi:hypothetical protein
VPPADRAHRKGFQQNAAKLSAGHLRSTAVALVGLIEQDVGVLVEDALRFSLSLDKPAEFLKESRRLECE